MAEGKVFAITGFGGGISVGVQGDTPDEFAALVAALRVKAQSDPVLAQLFAEVIGQFPQTYAPAVDEAQALANVQAAIPGSYVVPPTPISTVGQPLPVPQPVAQPVAQPAAQARALGAAAAPPGVAYPGDCAHGPREYKDTLARGKTWRRWECNVEWKRGVEGRCAAVNV